MFPKKCSSCVILAFPSADSPCTPSLLPPACPPSPHPNTSSLVFPVSLSWQLYLEHLPAHIVFFPAFHKTLPSSPRLSEQFKPVLFECTFDVLVPNLVLPCHSHGNRTILISAASYLLVITTISSAYIIAGLTTVLNITPLIFTGALLSHSIPVIFLHRVCTLFFTITQSSCSLRLLVFFSVEVQRIGVASCRAASLVTHIAGDTTASHTEPCVVTHH